jgi:single-strand DNA-binding protein
MSASINKVILIGNIGKEPEVRYTKDGKRIVTLSVVTADKSTNRHMKHHVERHRVIIFNEELVDTANKYLKKGTKVYIEGQLQTRKWSTNIGGWNTITEVVLPKGGGEIVMMNNSHVGGEDSN